MTDSSQDKNLTRHLGSCHCEAVKFEFLGDDNLHILECNCSVCRRTKFKHVIVPKNLFTLLEGEQALTEYSFGTHTAKHTFCAVCGVKPFYSPRSHPDAYSVNLRCVDQTNVQGITVEAFDDQNWEQAREGLQD